MYYKNLASLLIVIILLIGFTQGIVQSKLFQLRILVSRERILNFELSSKALQKRFTGDLQKSDDYQTEINQSLLESSILNQSVPEELDSSPWILLGTAVVNSVRIMSLKPILALHKERKNLLLLKYAFFMERIRRLSIASKKYEIILKRLGNQRSESKAFALLHNAYCLNSIGKRKDAIVLLKKVSENFPNTHYDKTASQLLKIAMKWEKIAQKIKSQDLNDLQTAQSLYRAGIYTDSCQYYEKQITNLGGLDNYYFAYCSEDTGNIKRAIKLYKEFIDNSSPQQFNVVRRANRRLLLLGEFYKGGKDAIEIAKKNASRLQDTSVLSKITQAAKKQKKSIVIEEIKEKIKQQEKDSKSTSIKKPTPNSELYQELGIELVTQANIEDQRLIALVEKKKKQEQEKIAKQKETQQKAQEIELLKKQEQEKTTKQKETQQKAKKIKLLKKQEQRKFVQAKKEGQVYLSLETIDKRKLRAEKIYFQQNKLLLKNNVVSTSIPLALVRRIVIIDERKKKTLIGQMKLYTTKGNYKGYSILISTEQDRILIGKKVFSRKDVKKIEFSTTSND